MAKCESYKYILGQVCPMSELLHYPTLRTILLVENVLKEHDGDLLSKGQIERLLGGRVHRRTLGLVLDYLEESNKIIQHPKKGILWIAASKEEIEKIRKNALRVV